MGDFFLNFWEIWTFSAFLWISNFLFCNFRRQSRTFWRNLKNLPEFLRKLKNEKTEDNFWEILRNISTRGAMEICNSYRVSMWRMFWNLRHGAPLLGTPILGTHYIVSRDAEVCGAERESSRMIRGRMHWAVYFALLSFAGGATLG